MKKTSPLLLALLMSVATVTHAGVFGSTDDSSSIDKGAARSMNKVLKGMVVQVSAAKIEESNSTGSTGALAGAAGGAMLGSGNSGFGGGSLFGGLLGAVAGGVAGAAVSAFAGSQTAQDILIQLEVGGDMVNITQAVDEKIGAYAEGDAVLIIYKGDSARVIRNKLSMKPAVAVATPGAN